MEITDRDGDTVTLEIGDWVSVRCDVADECDFGWVADIVDGLAEIAWSGENRTEMSADGFDRCLVFTRRDDAEEDCRESERIAAGSQ